jgi:hypothetical protein
MTTKAGDVLLAWHVVTGSHDEVPAGWTLTDVAAIEQEVRDDIRARVEGMMPTYPYTGAVVRERVLREVLVAISRHESVTEDGERPGLRAAALRLSDFIEHEWRTWFTDESCETVAFSATQQPELDELHDRLRAALAATPDAPEGPCCERERELREERVRTAYFHVAHDGTVRHPATCNDCRALEERQRGAEAPR